MTDLPGGPGAIRWGRLDALLLAAALAATAVVWHSLTQNFFFADDFLNLQMIVNARVDAYVLQPASGHLLILRNALFWLFYQAFGTRAELYFLMVLLTHLANVVLVFAV